MAIRRPKRTFFARDHARAPHRLATEEGIRRPNFHIGAGPAAPVVRSETKFLAMLCVFEVAYYLAYSYGMSFSQAASSPFWFPDTVLLCALLASPPGRWWIFVIALLPIRFFADVAANIPTWFLFATTANDIAKGTITAVLLRRFLENPLRLRTLSDYGLYFAIAVLLVPAASAVGGAGARSVLGDDFWRTWGQWLLGNATAHLILTPAAFYWILGAPDLIPLRSTRRIVEAAALAVALVIASYLAFMAHSSSTTIEDSLSFAPVPFLFWAAIRFGMLGASGAIVLIAVFAIEAALSGRGMFAGMTPFETAFALQEFLLVRAAPLYLVAILVQQMRDAEHHLRDSESRFRTVADTAPVLIWMSDAHGPLTFQNKVWLEFTGGRPDEELGYGWMRHIHNDDRDRVTRGYLGCLQRRDRFTAEFRFRRRGEAYRWMLFTGVPRFSHEGEFQGFIGSGIDIDDQKSAELDRLRHRAELAHITRVATMGELTASLAHELKQPLSAIMNNAHAAQLLLNAPTPALGEVRAILSDIRSDDERAATIINRLRDFLRKNEMIGEPISVNELVSDVLLLIEHELAERHISVKLDLAPSAPRVFGEKVHLQQVVLNLILNAVESFATLPPPEPLVCIRTNHRDDQTVQIAVADNGTGIPASVSQKLFEPFFTTKPRGLGMGLSIARTVIEAHDGKITVENNIERGATFRVTLPVLNTQDDG